MRKALLCLIIISLVLIGYGSALLIEPIAEQYTIGDTLEITGTTNLAAGNELIITIQSLSFEPTAKDTPAVFSGISGRTTVIQGEERNTWSFAADTSGFIADEYQLIVESVETDARATKTFRMIEKAPATPDPAPALPEEREPQPVPTEPEPAKTPGFGIMALITGIALALICLKR